MNKNVTIEKQNNVYAVIEEDQSIYGTCNNIKETVRVCSNLGFTILNFGYVLGECYLEDKKKEQIKKAVNRKINYIYKRSDVTLDYLRGLEENKLNELYKNIKTKIQ